MTTGLVLGKFYPLHLGHIGLINFAQEQCDNLIVLICASDKESVPGCLRLDWASQTFADNCKIKPTLFDYFENELPNTSISSREVSEKWAAKITQLFPKIDILFSSEDYGKYLSEFLKCKHITYEPARTTHEISASQIRHNAFKHWHYIADSAKPYYVKKICIYGTESTGKSTLAEKLATYYQTALVPEMAREIINETDECTEQNLIDIAQLHAKTITQKIKDANKLLIVDTDLNITRSYSKFLFGKELKVADWVIKANEFDLYLYLSNDSPHIQDGTRLEKERRNELNNFHHTELVDRRIKFEFITGTWEERFLKSVSIIDKLLM